MVLDVAAAVSALIAGVAAVPCLDRGDAFRGGARPRWGEEGELIGAHQPPLVRGHLSPQTAVGLDHSTRRRCSSMSRAAEDSGSFAAVDAAALPASVIRTRL